MAELVSLGSRRDYQVARRRDNHAVCSREMAGNLRCWLPESTRQTRPPAKAMDLVVPLRNTQDLHCPDANLER
ncbi:hypothetical protein IG631_02895 [Alternaria alternata]|nr:hypothetical protein IG631_02895 [Alternaria alternata]